MKLRINFLQIQAFKAALLIFTFSCVPLAADNIAAFQDPARIWGSGVERVIEEAYRAHFITLIIAGRIMNIRMPFAENNERDALSDIKWNFVGDGKAAPTVLWPIAREILASQDFALYIEALTDGREKIIIFDMPSRTWQISTDLFDISLMRQGDSNSYRGLPHRPHVLVDGVNFSELDVYNYLYTIGHIGIDCSGFVFYVLSHIAQQGGLDLGHALRASLRAPFRANPALYAGTAFFGSRNNQIISVNDRISNLRPADILLFRSSDGQMAHAAIIQSIDFQKGIIRYLQSTDEAPFKERGVHESFIYFDPARTNISLKDTSLRWTQERQAPFAGEISSPYRDDGERYRAYSELGGGRVVRLRLVTGVIERLR